MPLKIISTPDDPNNSRRAVYFPDARDRHDRPQHSRYERDASGRMIVRPGASGSPEKVAREFIVGLDLAQSNDFTAVAVVERLADGYAVPFLDRTRGRSYPDIVAGMKNLLARPELEGAEIVIDGTGIGRPVLDIFRASGIDARTVTITSGQKPTGTLRHAKVPKRDLVNVVLLALQAGTLQIASGSPHAATLAHELAELRAKISASGRDTYEAAAGAHDDLIIAVAIALWSLEKSPSRLR
ncbi:hypothetical protein GOD78_10995 [Sinorhizobium medicae]|nr:hypothetical protein [Sinorhizobium medicae]MDX0818044.1 hypothetical protein [Sinorhizobium medicae]